MKFGYKDYYGPYRKTKESAWEDLAKLNSEKGDSTRKKALLLTMKREVGVRRGGRKSAAVEEGLSPVEEGEEVAGVEEGGVISCSAGSGGGDEVRLRWGGGAKKKSKGTAQRSRREVHGSDYKGPPDELCLNVMSTDSGELRRRHSGGVAGGEVDVHQHHVPAREGAEAACIVPTVDQGKEEGA